MQNWNVSGTRYVAILWLRVKKGGENFLYQFLLWFFMVFLGALAEIS